MPLEQVVCAARAILFASSTRCIILADGVAHESDVQLQIQIRVPSGAPQEGPGRYRARVRPSARLIVVNYIKSDHAHERYTVSTCCADVGSSVCDLAMRAL